MIYLTGVIGPEVEAYRDHPRLGLLATPRSYGPEQIEQWPVRALDNGCYALRGAEFDEGAWRRWLDRCPREGTIFAAAPDVLNWVKGQPIGDAVATLRQAERYLPMVRDLGFRPALVLQDGMVPADIPWKELEAVFVGGSTHWKLGPEAHALVTEARVRGKHAHLGRVNSHRRIALGAAWGCATADGTFLRTAVRENIPRMLNWFAKLDAGVQLVFDASGAH